MVYNKKHMKPRVGSVWSRVGQSKIRYTSGKDFYLQNMALQKRKIRYDKGKNLVVIKFSCPLVYMIHVK